MSALAAVPARVWLAVALAASVGANLYQLYRAGVAKAEAEHAVDKAASAARETAQAAVLDATRLLAEARAEQRDALVTDILALHRAANAQVDRYRQWVSKLPPLPANCGPGQERVDAFNRYD